MSSIEEARARLRPGVLKAKLDALGVPLDKREKWRGQLPVETPPKATEHKPDDQHQDMCGGPRTNECGPTSQNPLQQQTDPQPGESTANTPPESDSDHPNAEAGNEPKPELNQTHEDSASTQGKTDDGHREAEEQVPAAIPPQSTDGHSDATNQSNHLKHPYEDSPPHSEQEAEKHSGSDSETNSESVDAKSSAQNQQPPQIQEQGPAAILPHIHPGESVDRDFNNTREEGLDSRFPGNETWWYDVRAQHQHQSVKNNSGAKPAQLDQAPPITELDVEEDVKSSISLEDAQLFYAKTKIYTAAIKEVLCDIEENPQEIDGYIQSVKEAAEESGQYEKLYIIALYLIQTGQALFCDIAGRFILNGKPAELPVAEDACITFNEDKTQLLSMKCDKPLLCTFSNTFHDKEDCLKDIFDDTTSVLIRIISAICPEGKCIESDSIVDFLAGVTN